VIKGYSIKEIVDYLNKKNIICKNLKPILPKELGSRKRVEIYIGVNLKGYYCSVFVIKKRSRIVRKEAFEIIGLHEKLEEYMDTKVFKRYIYIDAPLCSHAKSIMIESGWTIWDKAKT